MPGFRFGVNWLAKENLESSGLWSVIDCPNLIFFGDTFLPLRWVLTALWIVLFIFLV